MRRTSAIVIVGILIIPVLSAFCEDSSQYKSTSDIQKCCSEDGERQIYATTCPHNFTNCGNVDSKALCDPIGRKYIGKGNPENYLPCSLGPRIVIKGEFVDRRKVVVEQESKLTPKVYTEKKLMDAHHQTEPGKSNDLDTEALKDLLGNQAGKNLEGKLAGIPDAKQLFDQMSELGKALGNK